MRENIYKFEYYGLEDSNLNITDVWGVAFLEYNNYIVEYNYYIDNTTNEVIDGSAIYKVCSENMYNDFIQYSIDFNDKNWLFKLEHAMFNALCELYDLKVEV